MHKRLMLAVLMIVVAAIAFADDSGVLVSGVIADSPAERAGLIRGDVLLAIDGTAVNSVVEIRDVLAGYKAGQRVELTILRGGNQRKVPLTLEDRLFHPTIGIQFASGSRFQGMPDIQLGRGFGVGPVILEVVDGSPAAAAGLKAMDVITSVDGDQVPAMSFAALIQSHNPGDQITLEVTRKGEDQPINIKAQLGKDDNGKAYLGVRFGGQGFSTNGRPEIERRFNDMRNLPRDRGGSLQGIGVPGPSQPDTDQTTL